MSHSLQSAIRVLAVLLVVTLAISFVPPMLGKPVAENAAAAEELYVNVGWQSTVVNWNPLAIDMVEDYIIVYAIYSSLFTYNEDWEGPVRDLATGYYFQKHDNGSMTMYINITKNAYFRGISNPTDTSHPLDARDVSWTYNLIKNNSGGTFDWYLTDYSYFTAHERVAGEGFDQVRFWCPYVKAVIMEDITQVPILPRYHWEANAFDEKALSGMTPEQQIGSGPFMFESYSRDAWYKLKKAPNYHGETDFGAERTVGVDGVMFTVYGLVPPMCIDLDKGDLDIAVLTGDINAFKNSVGVSSSVNVIKAAVAEIGITDIAINAIPDAFDAGGGYLNRHPALLDPLVRKAIMMTLNKPYIVNDMLGGLPIMGSSVVQPGFWQADIQNQLPYDPAGAKAMLLANGWADSDGDTWLEATKDAFGVKQGWFDIGTELSDIRCQAPDTDPNYGYIAKAWPGWAKPAGIQLIGTVEVETTMINKAWYAADYDIWVWHWGWGPEPITGSVSCWTTSEIEKGGDNCQMPMGPWWAHQGNYTDCPFISDDMIEYYQIENKDTWNGRFSAFDQNMTDAMHILDVDERKVIIDKLQQWIYDSYCENPPYYDLGLYAFTDYKYDNWGDWEAHKGLNCQSDLPWIWFRLQKVVNRAPFYDEPPLADYTFYKDVENSVSVAVSDYEGDQIYVNISWGDGSEPFSRHLTGDTTTPTDVVASHTYTIPGTYTMNFSLTDLFEGRYLYREAPTIVYGDYNQPATITHFYPDNPSPSYVDEVITWTAVAVDPDSGTAETGLKFTWDWGDGTFTVDPPTTPVPDGTPVVSVQSHSWPVDGQYEVVVNVFDMVEGEEIGEHNVSSSIDYLVVVNQPPTTPVVQAIGGLPGEPVTCVASSSDPDVESLTFTWEWDDGTYDVEVLTPTYANQVMFHSVERTWADEGTYAVTVWVEDEEGHNVSSEETVVTIAADTNFVPSGVVVTISPEPIYAGTETLFNISARDVNGDAITFTVDFGDDSDPETETSEVGTKDAQYAEFTHTYEDEGTYTLTVEVEDDELSQTLTFALDVSGNKAPVLRIQSTYSARYSELVKITPIEASDPDGDAIEVWYDWGDDSPMTAGNPSDGYSSNHTYMAVGVFEVSMYIDDGNPGHNLTQTASMTVSELNIKAVVEDIKTSPAKTSYAIGETVTFTVRVSDLEGDNATVRIEFGDGASDQAVIDLAPATPTFLNFTHEYEKGGKKYIVNVTADDGQPHSDATLVKRSIEVTIDKPAGINMFLVLGIVVLVLVAIVAVAMLMKRKKGGAATDMSVGGMEGMAPPEETSPPPPPQ